MFNYTAPHLSPRSLGHKYHHLSAIVRIPYCLAQTGLFAAQTTYPTIVELELVFPREGISAPAELMPLVFAVQNSQAVPSLGLTVGWQIGKIDGSENPLFSGFWGLTSTNYSSDQYYIFTHIQLSNQTKGDFRVPWYVYANNCSSIDSTDPSRAGINATFTLKKRAQQPDLVAATSPETCATMSNQTFDIVGSVPYRNNIGEGGRNSCTVLAEPSPIASPCALPLDAAQTSIISASITAAACARSNPDLEIGCPQPTQMSSANLAL